MADHPSVTVVIPVRNDRRIADCLSRLAAQDYPGEVDVIVADNDSEVDLAQLVRDWAGEHELSVRFLSQPNGGSYTARNAAVQIAKGEMLAFTDADCLPAQGWLSAAVAAITDGVDVVAGRIKVYVRDPRRPNAAEAYELVHAFPQERYVRRNGACVTANLVTPRRVFDAVGPFLDSLESGADIEWSQRAHGAGYRARYVPDALVLHPARTSFAELNGKLRRVIRGRIERDRLADSTAIAPFPSPRAWVPPVGAIGRAIRHPELTTFQARSALVTGEVYHRYAAALIATRAAFRSRREPTASG